MLRKTLLPLAVFAALLLAVGCSDSTSTQSDPSSQTENFTETFGGYTATAESPAFGDQTLLTESAGEVEFDDPILLSPSVDSIVNDSEAGIYHFRAVWGQLRFDSTVTNVTDWTGSLTVSRGAMVVRRIIRFERGQDYVLDRTDRKLIEWVSATTVHHDGLAIEIFIPKVDDSDSLMGADTQVTVTFETGPYSRTFTLAEIAALDTIVTLDDADSNAVAFFGFRHYRERCRKGFVTGGWGFDDDGMGRFRGAWTSRNGQLIGYLQGHFGRDDNGRNMFYGKWISADGSFEGFVKGTWQSRVPNHVPDHARKYAGGWFKGYVYDAAEQQIGELMGKYRSGPNRSGFFQGRWKAGCSNQFGVDTDDVEIDDDVDDGFDD